MADIATVVDRIARGLIGAEAEAVRDNLFCDDAVPEIKDLPDFLARRVLSDGQEYHGCRVLVYDSIQGRGLAADGSVVSASMATGEGQSCRRASAAYLSISN